MGLPIIDGPHPYFRTVTRTQEEPILLTERKPSRPPPPPPVRGRGQPTIEIDLNDAGVEIIDDTRPVAPVSGFPRPPMMAPPPKRERPISVPPQPAADVPAAQQSEPQRPSAESAAFSLPELIAVATGKKKPAPIPQQPARPQESSVMRSMAGLQEIERERVANEAAAKAQAAEEEQSLQANLLRLVEDHQQAVEDEERAREQSLLDSLGVIHEIGKQRAEEAASSLLSTYGGAESPEKQAETTPVPTGTKSEPFVFLDPEIIEPDVEEPEEKSISISIQLLVGLPWEDQHSIYKLSGREQEACENALPERETRWVLPVPPRDSKEKGDIGILQQFAKETRREFNNREYYIVEAPFAGAKRAARKSTT